ncbi:MAG: adenosylmethionine decarboxylase [Thermoplasmatales archaeon]|jgi:S-adenosylmethionine decarboxylase proenzyme, Bacillus form
MSIGIHIIADLKGVSSEKISSVNEMKKIIENSVKAGHLTKIRSHYHQFSPTGVSGIVLIAESHISFHTWPEYGLVTLDVFTCGPTEGAEAAFEFIMKELQPKETEYRKIERGIEYPRGTVKGKVAVEV